MITVTLSLSFHSIHHFNIAIQWFANFRGLKLTHFFILALILLFQHATLIPTLEGFSVTHVERQWCVLCKSLIMCKVILPTQSVQLDAVVCYHSKILNKSVYKGNKWNNFGRHDQTYGTVRRVIMEFTVLQKFSESCIKCVRWLLDQ